MAIPIHLKYAKTIPSARSESDVLKYLSNWEKAIPQNFPGIELFESQGENRYRWDFEKLSHSGKDIQIQFETDLIPAGNRLEIVPVPGSGSATLGGSWTVEKAGPGSQIRFQVDIQLELPLPGFLKSMVSPIATKELTKLFDTYVQRLEKSLG